MIFALVSFPFVESAMAAPHSVDGLIAKNQFAINRGSLPLLSAELGDDTIAALASRSDLPPIRDLLLSRNRLGPAGVAALLQASWLVAPRALDVQSNPSLGEPGFRLIGQSERLRTLETLFVAGSGGTASAYLSLLGSGNLRAIERFQGGADQAGDTGAIALLGLPALRFATLKQAHVGPIGARALLGHPTLETVDNPAGDDGVRALAGAPWLSRLTSLTLAGSGASEAALAELRAAWGSRRGLAIGR